MSHIHARPRNGFLPQPSVSTAAAETAAAAGREGAAPLLRGQLVRSQDPEAAAALQSKVERSAEAVCYRRSVLLSHLWFASLLLPLVYDAIVVPFSVCFLYRTSSVHWELVVADVLTGIVPSFIRINVGLTLSSVC